jgi:acyl-CoA synthetase (AMP-forming)/AMP-acid ligase II
MLEAQPRNLLDYLSAAPADRPFVTEWHDSDDCRTLTFEQVRAQAAAQAGRLQQEGIRTGDRVIIVMPQTIEAVAAFLGVMMLGAVPAFLAYPNFKVEPGKYRAGLLGVTRNLSAMAVLIDSDFPEEMLEYVRCDQSRVLRSDKSIAYCGVSNDRNWPRAALTDVAFIQHSAGTTGLQKGVPLSHQAVLRQIGHLREALNVNGEQDRIYSWLPLYHDMGLIACFILPLVCHTHVVMQSPTEWVMRPDSMLQVVTEHRCTLAWMPNFAFQFIARRTPPNRRHRYNLSSIRALINCSEPVRDSSMGEFEAAFSPIGLKSNCLHASYAMAENVFAVTQTALATGPGRVSLDGPRFRAEHKVTMVSADSPGAIVFASSGPALPGNHIRLEDEEGVILGDGQVGVIVISSDTLFEGYLNRPDLTAEVVEDGWYRTGDLGFTLDGELFVVGRKKDLLIVAGENIYPQDIEEAASEHPAVHEGRAIALGLYNPGLGTEDVVVVAEVNDHGALAQSESLERELRQFIMAQTGVAVRTVLLKSPRWIVKSTAGKPARSATREKLLREHPELVTGELD